MDDSSLINITSLVEKSVVLSTACIEPRTWKSDITYSIVHFEIYLHCLLQVIEKLYRRIPIPVLTTVPKVT